MLFLIITSTKKAYCQLSLAITQNAANICNDGWASYELNGIPQGHLFDYTYDWKVNGTSVSVNNTNLLFAPDIIFELRRNHLTSTTQYDVIVDVTEISTSTLTHVVAQSVYDIANLYTKMDLTLIKSSDGLPTLDATITTSPNVQPPWGSSFNWFEYFPFTSTSSSQVGGPQVFNYNLTPLTDGYHYFYYKHYTNGLNCHPMSGIYSVYVSKQLDIIANTTSPYPPGSELDWDNHLTGNTGPTSTSYLGLFDSTFYTDFQWYRNGQLIPGANLRKYTANLPGDYELHATIIGTNTIRISNTISINCNPAGIVTKSNYTFPAGTTNLSGYLKFDGTVTIPAGAIVNINNAKIHMTSCAEVIVDKNGNNNLAGGRLNITNTTVSGCALWKWIKVLGNNGIGNPVQDGQLILDNTQISDASMAIYALNHGTLSITNTTFEDNASHLAVVNCPNIASTISSSKFSFLKPTGNCISTSIYPNVNANYTTVVKMVYLHNTSGIVFSNSNFEPYQTSTSSPIANGIEAYSCNKSVNAAYSFNIQSCSFKGLFDQGVYLFQCELPLINGTTSVSYNIEGDFTNVFYFDQCNKPSIIDQKMHPGAGSQTSLRGILSYQSDKLYCYNNKVNGFERGIEFYQQTASNNQTVIEHNSLLNNDYGVVIAPEVFPVNNTANPNPNATYYNNQRNVRLLCNKFYDCNWGVVGVGNIITLSTLNNNNNEDWDCFFTSNAGGNNYSKKADVAWYDYNNNNNSARPITIYYDQFNYQLGFSSANSISLDGNNITSGNIFTTYVNQQQATGQGCRGSFKTDPLPPPTAKNASTANDAVIYPNPFGYKFTIKGNQSILANYVLYDITGKVVLQGTSNGLNELQIDATNFPVGCYLLKLTDLTTGKNIQTTRLVKISE